MTQLIRKFESNQVFSADESWMLFKLCAFAEAIGWTLLIAGILISRFVLANNQMPIQIAGRIHGMLFLAYLLASIGLYPTLKWPRHKALIALLSSVPPYGSLVFEQWESNRRKGEHFNIHKNFVVFKILTAANT